MGIRAAWEASLTRQGHIRDPAQEQLIARFEKLQERLTARTSTSWLSRLLRRKPPAVRGLYVWGGVGRGKTFLMDLFVETLAVDNARRIHFHRMMHDVHARLKAQEDVEDPLDRVAADIARDTRVLCFDEFFVSDIGDAMILARLLEGLFTRGVTLVATSNSRPDDLYRDGLQRSRFLPAIDLLNKYTDVVELDSGTDYRLKLLQEAGTYLSPCDADALARLEHLFDDSASSHVAVNRALDINGRDILALKCAKGIAWFDFNDICDGPRSQADYIELARWYPTVIVSGVPVLHGNQEDQARRFIALVDEFYDRRVKLILGAAAEPHGLYAGSKLSFEFDRTVSRLIEMQSRRYLSLPHLA